MLLALSICVLFISLKETVNTAQVSNTIYLSLLFGLSPACAEIIVPLTSVYAPL